MTPTANLKNQEKGHCATVNQKSLRHSAHRIGPNPIPDERMVDWPYQLKKELVFHLQKTKMEYAMNMLFHRLNFIRALGAEGKDWRYTVDGEIEIRSNLYSKKTFGMLLIRFDSNEGLSGWSWKGSRGRESRLKKAPLPYAQDVIVTPHSMGQYLKRRAHSSRIHAFPEIVKAYVEGEMAVQTKLERSWHNGRLQWLLALPQFGVVAVFIHDVSTKSIVMTTTLSPFQAELQVLASNPWRPSKVLQNNMKAVMA
jgi:hypothetical protein